MTAPIHLSRRKVEKNPRVLLDAVHEYLSFADLQKLTPVQRIAYLAHRYSAVEAIGHEDFFGSPLPSYPEVIAALGAIGAKAQAAVLTDALEAVRVHESETAPAASAPGWFSFFRRNRSQFSDLNRFDKAYACCEPDLFDCLLDYVAKNESEFIEWKP